MATSTKAFRNVLGLASAWVVACALPSNAAAFDPYLVVPEPAVAERAPAYRYANASDAEVFAELDRRGVPYVRVDPVAGVRSPVRLAGPLHGVHVHSSLPVEKRPTSVFEILDARLALALDDFCALLERHGIDEVVHYTMYRPNVGGPPGLHPEVAPAPVPPAKATPAPPDKTLAKTKPAAAPKTARVAERAKTEAPTNAKPAERSRAGKPTLARTAAKSDPQAQPAPAKARTVARVGQTPGARPAGIAPPAPVPAVATSSSAHPQLAPAPVAPAAPASAVAAPRSTWAAPGTRHPAGLAIDVGSLHTKDGRWLNVGARFHGHIGDKTCGEGAPTRDEADARELRAIVCEASALGLFSYILTPNYNAAHADHFHMEIKSGVHWFLVH